MKQCAWCGADFDGGRGQIYCCVEHRIQAIEVATNRRKREAKVARRRKANRVCSVCGIKLSIYGEGTTCSLHVNPKQLVAVLEQIKRQS